MKTKSAVMVYYSLGELSAGQKSKFCRGFWGYKDKSTYGKYAYQRKGIMSDISHIRLAPSLLIIPEKNRPELEKFLQKFDVVPFIRTVILEKDDTEVLSR